MNSKQIQTFLTLSIEKNYIKAAEKCHYAPSTLAKHIHALEDELGVSLVEFRDGKIVLTDEGMHFLRYAKELQEINDKVMNEFHMNDDQPEAIRIAGGELMVGFAFAPLFSAIEKKDELNLQVNPICCSRVPEWLKTNEVDVGYVQVMAPYADEEDKEMIPLFQEKLCLMASVDHPLAQADCVHTAELDGMNFSFTYENCCFTDEFRCLLRSNGIRPASEFFLGSIQAVIHSAREDQRICLIPYVSIPAVASQGLVKLNWDGEFDIYDVMLMQKDISRNSQMKSLIRKTKTYVKNIKTETDRSDIIIL